MHDFYQDHPDAAYWAAVAAAQARKARARCPGTPSRSERKPRKRAKEIRRCIHRSLRHLCSL